MCKWGKHEVGSCSRGAWHGLGWGCSCASPTNVWCIAISTLRFRRTASWSPPWKATRRRSGGAPTVRDLVIRRCIRRRCHRRRDALRPGAAMLAGLAGLESRRQAPELRAAHPGQPCALAVRSGAPTAAACTSCSTSAAPSTTYAMCRMAGSPCWRPQNATKEVGATEAGAAIAGDLDAPPPEQRIAVLEQGALRWVSPPDLFVYEYDWRAGRQRLRRHGRSRRRRQQLVDAPSCMPSPRAAPVRASSTARPTLGNSSRCPRYRATVRMVAFIAGIMSDFGSTGGDVYTLALDGGAATNLTPDIACFGDRAVLATATAICRPNCSPATKLSSWIWARGSRRRPRASCGAARNRSAIAPAGISTACPSGMTADAHESFTAAPEIEIGTDRPLARSDRGQCRA